MGEAPVRGAVPNPPLEADPLCCHLGHSTFSSRKPPWQCPYSGLDSPQPPGTRSLRDSTAEKPPGTLKVWGLGLRIYIVTKDRKSPEVLCQGSWQFRAQWEPGHFIVRAISHHFWLSSWGSPCPESMSSSLFLVVGNTTWEAHQRRPQENQERGARQAGQEAAAELAEAHRASAPA